MAYALTERGAYGASSLAGGDHPSDHPVCVTGHPGGVFPHHDGAEEAPVGGHVQPQLTGGSRCQAGDGQRPQSAPRREADLSPAVLPRSLTSSGCSVSTVSKGPREHVLCSVKLLGSPALQEKKMEDKSTILRLGKLLMLKPQRWTGKGQRLERGSRLITQSVLSGAVWMSPCKVKC